MDWKKSKLNRWQAGPFTITEETGVRPYRLDGTDDQPKHFENLTEAKAHASTLNELNLQRDEVARLRAELDELRQLDRWPVQDALAAQRFDGITDGEEDRPIEDAYTDGDRCIPLHVNGHTANAPF